MTALIIWALFSVFYLTALLLSGRISNYKPYTWYTYVETVLILPAVLIMFVISWIIWIYEEIV